MIKLIVWDFNGTVIDDVDTSVAAVNSMLKDRGLPPTNKQEYVKNLVMPLDKYYNTVGIYNADISKLSLEFRTKCLQNEHLSKIFDDFFPVIDKVRKLGIKNVLVSSLYEEFLKDEVKKYNISDYFDIIKGMQNTKVESKLQNAKECINKLSIPMKNVLFVGDLLSDAAVANELDAHCVLVCRGHTSKKRCQSAGVPVYENLTQILNYIEDK